MEREELIEEGIVKEVNGTLAVISLDDSDNCEECSARIVCKPSGKEGRTLTARDPFGVHPGDKVRVSIKGRDILKISFLLYGLPLLLMLAAIYFGMNIFKTNIEIYSTLLGTVVIAIYVLLFFVFSKLRGSEHNKYPTIVFVSTPSNSF